MLGKPEVADSMAGFEDSDDKLPSKLKSFFSYRFEQILQFKCIWATAVK